MNIEHFKTNKLYEKLIKQIWNHKIIETQILIVSCKAYKRGVNMCFDYYIIALKML